MDTLCRPLKSLKEGRWFKLICGASYQYLPAIRDLTVVYGLAGADCIDVSADLAVVEVVKDAFQILSSLHSSNDLSNRSRSSSAELPLLMVSFSDGEDPHFRKAVFDPVTCPPDCLRPCESSCPTSAIVFDEETSGVIEERCYGCGRCLPVCPIQNINTVTRATTFAAIAPSILEKVDAIEVHTQVGRYDAFMSLWLLLQPSVSHLSAISVSCPDEEGAIEYLWELYEGMQPLTIPLIWQADGRPMSGDIGKGTTHATLKFAQKLLRSGPPGFVQLAGGTNAHTVSKLDWLLASSETHDAVSLNFAESESAYTKPTFGGIAYGSFARQLVTPLIEDMVSPCSGSVSISEATSMTSRPAINAPKALPGYLTQALASAQSLVTPLKAF